MKGYNKVCFQKTSVGYCRDARATEVSMLSGIQDSIFNIQQLSGHLARTEL
jgi:hypothetical protein